MTTGTSCYGNKRATMVDFNVGFCGYADLGVLSPGRLNASLANSGGMPEAGHLSSSAATWKMDEREEPIRREEKTTSEGYWCLFNGLHLQS